MPCGRIWPSSASWLRRGDDGIDANGRDRRLGEPVTGHAILERGRMFGTQSADYITASGHSGRIVTEASLQAKTGRIHDRTRTLRSTVRFLLHRGHRPYMTLHCHWLS